MRFSVFTEKIDQNAQKIDQASILAESLIQQGGELCNTKERIDPTIDQITTLESIAQQGGQQLDQKIIDQIDQKSNSEGDLNDLVAPISKVTAPISELIAPNSEAKEDIGDTSTLDASIFSISENLEPESITQQGVEAIDQNLYSSLLFSEGKKPEATAQQGVDQVEQKIDHASIFSEVPIKEYQTEPTSLYGITPYKKGQKLRYIGPLTCKWLEDAKDKVFTVLFVQRSQHLTGNKYQYGCEVEGVSGCSSWISHKDLIPVEAEGSVV